MRSGEYAIGSGIWPGLSKLIEEAGEVQQVVGKLIAIGGDADHWDGSDLHERIVEEIGDLMAACDFVVEANGLDRTLLTRRRKEKLALFRGWQKEQGPSPEEGLVRVNRVDLARVYEAVGDDMVVEYRAECDMLVASETDATVDVSRAALESLLAYADNFGGSFDLGQRDAEERLRRALGRTE